MVEEEEIKLFKLLLIITLISGISLSLINNEALANKAGIHEDQFIVCNFESVCTIINTDEYMSSRASEDLWISFINDLDTFDMSELN